MIRYAAIGDSLTAGVGDLFGGGFVPKYGRFIQLAMQQQVTYDKIGFPGARSAYILAVIRNDNKVRDILQQADIITLTVGGNDLVDAAKAYAVQQNDEPFRQALANCKHNFAGILSVIRHLKYGGNPYLIRAVNLYNPSPSLPESDYWVKRFNQHLESFEDANLKVANIFNSFQGKERTFLWIDRLHPNGRGYQVIAEALQEEGYTPLA